jgi:hypothetical protein
MSDNLAASLISPFYCNTYSDATCLLTTVKSFFPSLLSISDSFHGNTLVLLSSLVIDV